MPTLTAEELATLSAFMVKVEAIARRIGVADFSVTFTASRPDKDDAMITVIDIDGAVPPIDGEDWGEGRMYGDDADGNGVTWLVA